MPKIPISKRVKLTLTPEEWEEAKLDARKFQKPVATHMKNVAFCHIRHTYQFPAGLDLEMHQFTLVMRGMGNNLNQMARIANADQMFPKDEFVRLKLQIHNMEDIVTRFINHLYSAYAHKIYESKK